MTRFVIANRRRGLFEEADKVRSRMSVAIALGGIMSANVVEDHQPDDPTARRVVVVEASPMEIEQKLAEFPPDVMIEPEIIHLPTVVPPPDLRVVQPPPAMPMDAGWPMQVVRVTGGGAPLEGANVMLHTRSIAGIARSEQRTDATGTVQFPIAPGHTPAAAVVVPAHGFWTMVARGPQLSQVVECPPLPTDGPLGWWHNILGLGALNLNLGAGIRVGVIDSGLGSNAALAHAQGIGSFIDGAVDTSAAATVGTDPHGTHVAGTICGLPVIAGGYAGIAPACELLAARVFAPGKGANQADIANAIDALSRDHQVDLINMSLGASSPSQILHDAIADAYERGTLCIAAAGNEAGPVGYPAAFSEVICVAALGLEGWGPPGSLSSTRLPSDASLFGRDGLYVANFSCFGPEVDCAAPGVGILATMPAIPGVDEAYGGMDGTSMASPAACGILATLLSRDPSYPGLPRDENRAAAARRILIAATRDAGLPRTHQGQGIPSI